MEKKDMSIYRLAYLLYLYPYSDCPKSLYISERMILLILCSGRDIVTTMDFCSMPRKAGQFSLVLEMRQVYKRKTEVIGKTKLEQRVQLDRRNRDDTSFGFYSHLRLIGATHWC